MKQRNLFSILTAALMLFAFTSTVVAGDKMKTSEKVNSPDKLKAEKTDDANVKLSWASVSDADQYKVYRAELTHNELKEIHKGTEMKTEGHKESMEKEAKSKMEKSEMFGSIDIENIDQKKLNFREIGTTTNTEFVDRTVETALRTHKAGSEQYAMGEAERGPRAEEEMSSINEIVFVYSVAAVDDEGNPGKKSNLTTVDFDKSAESEKTHEKKSREY